MSEACRRCGGEGVDSQMTDAPSAAIPARSWLFVYNRPAPARKKGTLFFPGAYVRWRMQRWQQIAAGDIVYINSVNDGGLVGWALVREGTELQSPESESVGVHLQMLGHAPRPVAEEQVTSIIARPVHEHEEIEIAEHAARALDQLLSGAGVLAPNGHPEVTRLRSELSARSRQPTTSKHETNQQSTTTVPLGTSAQVSVEGGVVSDIGPLAAVEGKWAQVRQLAELKLAGTGDYFSHWVRATLAAASNLAERESQEQYRVVDTPELLKGILARAQLGRSTSNPANAPWEVFDWLSRKLTGMGKSFPAMSVDALSSNTNNAVASPRVTSILAEAARIARVSHPGPISTDTRHLIAALILSSHGRQSFAELDLAVGDPRAFFLEAGQSLRAHLDRTASEFGDDLMTWNSVLDRVQSVDLTTVSGKASVTIEHTAYAADRPGKLAEDALDAAEDARALAELICLDEAQPPLAIGLFGDWGSGKSTFMEMLAEAIDEITARAARETKLPFVDRVAHIRFNAWHYMDANLWASLVTHIFKELHRQSRDKDQPKDWLKETQLDGLIQQLGIVQQAEGEARKQLEILAQEIDNTKTALANIERERAKARMQLVGEYAGDMLELVAVGGPNSEVGKAALAIGLGVDRLTARQLHETISEAATLGGRLKLLVTTLTMGTDRGLKWLLLGIVAFVAVGGSAAVLAALVPGLQPIATTLGTVLGLVSGAGAWLGPHLRDINKSLGPLMDAHNDIMTKFQQQEHERAEQEAETKARLEQYELQQKQQERGLQEKLDERQRLEAIARGERPTELLTRFIESRTQTEEYRKHLGLLSFVRNDFEKVSALMREQRKTPDPSLPSIDRIVLYIDDLDRCQDRQVVQVLEAVHLLLAFDLFVVVVGVDARWLHRALEKIYPGQLGEDGDAHATPADYLEKIFQIPFWLRPLDYGEQGTFGRLIDKLIGSDVEVTTPPPPAPPPATDEDSPSGAGDGTPPEDAAEGGDEVTTIIAPITVTLPEETPEETLRRVRLRDTEVALMKALGPLIGKSPRATKRFVNLYRLVRARKRGAELQAFLDGAGDAPARYPAVMLALAIETGLSAQDAATVWSRMQKVGETESIGFQFLTDEKDPDRRMNAAVHAVEPLIGRNLTRGYVSPAIAEIARYSFSRPR